MMEFFQEQTSPPAAEQTFVDFTTANPAVSSACNWISIEAQQEQLEPSHVAIRQNAETRTFVGNTSNVARLAIDVTHLAAGQPVDVTLDGQALNWLNASKDTHKLWFERQGNDWAAAEAPEPRLKRPARYGTFNSAFDNRAMLVYGTAGNEGENAWAAAKALETGWPLRPLPQWGRSSAGLRCSPRRSCPCWQRSSKRLAHPSSRTLRRRPPSSCSVGPAQPPGYSYSTPSGNGASVACGARWWMP
jgi:hypothetical protein